MAIRVLIVDDNERIRTGLVTVLSSDLQVEVVGEASSGPAGVHLARETAPVQALGAKWPRRIVLTAGEPLGQGTRVARAAAAAGHRITYTPDISVAGLVDGVDAFVTGVESFYTDGSLANTVGTRMLSLLCRDAGVPVIAPAELLKLDNDRPTVANPDLKALLLQPVAGR